MSDCRFDRDGNRIENPIPGQPGGESASERADRERGQAYTHARNTGGLPQWYAYFDPANNPYAREQDEERER